jgi:hypothetical protein
MRKNTASANMVRIVIFIGIILTLISCTKDKSVEPQTELPKTPFTGITHTDSTGIVNGSVDPDDWKPISAIGMEFSRGIGTYPNPCNAEWGCSIAWLQRTRDSVLITINDSPTHILKTFNFIRLDSGLIGYGFYNHALSGLQPAIYRLYFHVIRPDTTYTTYGDIQVN